MYSTIFAVESIIPSIMHRDDIVNAIASRWKSLKSIDFSATRIVSIDVIGVTSHELNIIASVIDDSITIVDSPAFLLAITGWTKGLFI